MQLSRSNVIVAIASICTGYSLATSQRDGDTTFNSKLSTSQNQALRDILKNSRLTTDQKLGQIHSLTKPSDLKLPEVKFKVFSQDGTQMNIENPGKIPGLMPTIKSKGGFSLVGQGSSDSFIYLGKVSPIVDSCLSEMLRLTKNKLSIGEVESKIKTEKPKIEPFEIVLTKLYMCQTWLKELK